MFGGLEKLEKIRKKGNVRGSGNFGVRQNNIKSEEVREIEHEEILEIPQSLHVLPQRTVHFVCILSEKTPLNVDFMIGILETCAASCQTSNIGNNL